MGKRIRENDNVIDGSCDNILLFFLSKSLKMSAINHTLKRYALVRWYSIEIKSMILEAVYLGLHLGTTTS